MKLKGLFAIGLFAFVSNQGHAQEVNSLSLGSLGSDPSSVSHAGATSKRGSAGEGHATAAEQSIEGTSSISTNIGTAVPKPPSRAWGVEIYGEDYYGVSDANHQTGKMETAQFVGFTYQFSPVLSGYIRQNFAASIDRTPQKDRTATGGDDVRLGDTELGLATKKLLTWNGGGLNVTHRLYLPTGKYAIAGGEITYLREIVVASKMINRYFEGGFAGDFRGAVFAKNGYQDKFGTSKLNRNLLMNPALFLTGKANDKISATVYAGTLDVLKHSYNGSEGTHGSATYLDTSISAQIAPQLALTIGAENDMNIGKSQIGHPRLYRADETQYYLNLYASL